MLNSSALRLWRKKRKLSQAEAARRAGMASAQKWSDFECGQRVNPTADTIQRMAKALECKPGDLLK